MAAAGWVLLAAGCEQPRTELVARVESEVAWGAGRTVQSVTLSVRRGGPTGPLRSARTTALGAGGERRPLPLLVGIVPADDTDTPVWIEALGCRAPNGCTAATAAVAQRAVVRFAVGQTQEVPLLLASACVGVTCGSDERCGVAGRCEPATRATVRPFDGRDAGVVTDVTMDAGRVDAARDVPIISDISADMAVAVDAPTVDLPALDTAPPEDAPPSDTAASCGSLELRCGGACVAALRDPMNCGACGEVCPAVAGATATCMGGRCGYACDAAHADCDERASNGCEQDITTDVAHCGACNRACAAARGTAGCADGACTVVSCNAGFGDCDGAATNGCETDVHANDAHCGRCGVTCLAGRRCQASLCVPTTCPTGMLYITGGTFTMGSDAAPREQPMHAVTLSSFCLDATEVTRAAYRNCSTAGACSIANSASGCVWDRADRDSYPMNCVTWDQARSFCMWRGGDLPTEAQWEYAARGTDGRTWPWGNADPSDRLLNFNSSDARPVASYPAGVSPFGAFDMAGNIQEWVADWYGPYTAGAVTNPTGPASGTLRVERGGPFGTTYGNEVRSAYRYTDPPTYRAGGVGFRCARNP